MARPMDYRDWTSPAARVAHSPPDTDASFARIELLSRVMDSIVTIPGTNVRIGVDAILGLVPVVGDLISQAISSYIIWEARKLGVSRWTIARMIGNSAIDTVVGAVPLVGDLFDVAFKANTKNLALLKAHLERQGQLATARSMSGPARGPVIDATFSRLD